MHQERIDVGRIRREQIVEAAVAVITEEGLQNLSLSAIEKRAGMSRGQLTYYFPAKEDILLAVFDRLLQLLKERARAETSTPCHAGGTPWDRLRHFLTYVLLDPPSMPEFHALQYTFLSQIGHREDYRRRLAELYGAWREHMAADLASQLARRGELAVSARTFATLVQALIHGLTMQRAADSEAFDRQEMLTLCLDLLGSYLRPTNPAAGVAARRRPRRARHPKVTHE
jgi:AcrR family transcriptional regulator